MKRARESILSSCYILRRTPQETRRGYIFPPFRETPDDVVTFQYFSSFFYPQSCLNVPTKYARLRCHRRLETLR